MFIWKDQFEALVAERDRLFSQYVGERNVSAALRKTNESLAEVNRGLVHERQALIEQLRVQANGTGVSVSNLSHGGAKITTTAPIVGKIKSKHKKK